MLGIYGSLDSVGAIAGPVVGTALVGFFDIQIALLAIGVMVLLDGINIGLGIPADS